VATGGETRTVELLRAFLWTCDDCGRDNFERAVTISPESIDPENLPEVPGLDRETLQEWIESGGQGEWVTAPRHVRCKHCNARFDVSQGE
jgi:hypothetical protein